MYGTPRECCIYDMEWAFAIHINSLSDEGWQRYLPVVKFRIIISAHLCIEDMTGRWAVSGWCFTSLASWAQFEADEFSWLNNKIFRWDLHAHLRRVLLNAKRTYTSWFSQFSINAVSVRGIPIYSNPHIYILKHTELRYPLSEWMFTCGKNSGVVGICQEPPTNILTHSSKLVSSSRPKKIALSLSLSFCMYINPENDTYFKLNEMMGLCRSNTNSRHTHHSNTHTYEWIFPFRCLQSASKNQKIFFMQFLCEMNWIGFK